MDSDGALRVEADGVVLRVVGAGNRDGLGVDPGVEPEDLVRVALHVARVDDDPGSVLGADDAQLERMVGVDARGVGGDGRGVCVHYDGCCVCAVCGWFVERLPLMSLRVRMSRDGSSRLVLRYTAVGEELSVCTKEKLLEQTDAGLWPVPPARDHLGPPGHRPLQRAPPRRARAGLPRGPHQG
jgi:hypothetical protein